MHYARTVIVCAFAHIPTIQMRTHQNNFVGKFRTFDFCYYIICCYFAFGGTFQIDTHICFIIRTNSV